jgi:DNA mismatch repair protein MutL
LDDGPQTADGKPQIDASWVLGHDTGGEEIPVDGQSPTGNGQVSKIVTQPSVFEKVPLLRLIGQIGATYLVAEGPDGLYLIDQHAAHERVLFEKLMAQHEQKAIPSQALLTPVVVHLPSQSARLLEDQLPVLLHFGFHVESFGHNSYQVRAVPALFANSDLAAALRALVEDFEEDEAPLQNELEAKIAGRVCKRLAVKAGQVLTPDEQHALLNDLETCTAPRTCPHGRPTMIHLSVDTLERQFGRKGAR